jgi:putative tricarboxylic transport membrane protein
LFAPTLFVICLVGSFALRNNIGDVLVTCVFGILGYEMKKFEFSRIALVLGLLLGNMAETAFRQTLMTEGGWVNFFGRPISVGLFILIIATVTFPHIKAYYKAKKS